MESKMVLFLTVYMGYIYLFINPKIRKQSQWQSQLQ